MARNPYERNEDLDIPDFVEDKNSNDTSTSIDMSIFKMSDDELYDTDEYEEYDDDEEYVSKSKKRKKMMPLIICMIIIFLLLIVSIASIFYALKQHESYVKANTAYLQLQANEESYLQQLSQKDAQIDALNAELEALKNNSQGGGQGSLVYEITDGPVSFRNKPSRTADKTEYNGEEYAYNNEKFNVIEVVKGEDDPDYSWAKLKDNVYFCLGTSDEVWAKKVD